MIYNLFKISRLGMTGFHFRASDSQIYIIFAGLFGLQRNGQ